MRRKSRRQPLVSQFLERVSRKALADYQDIIREFVRRRHGIYALYKNEKLYYVGLASNLRNRLKAHLKDRHGESWDRFSVYLTIDDGHIRELESLALRIVKPSGNRQIGKFAHAENLRPKLARLIRSNERERLRDLLGMSSGKTKKGLSGTKAVDPGIGAAVLAGYIKGTMHLRGTHKGKLIKARVRRNGSIHFGGKIYNSPSMAAAAAVGRETSNGWTFWTYERAPGDWVKLAELRD
jgi:hypothetical protein